LYLPRYFQEDRTEVLHGMMRAAPLATLITVCDAGIVANHIPMETSSEAQFGVLRGHIARANSLWRDYRPGTEALAVFQGPQTYISPSFYATKTETGKVVPTWDYAVVHARGTLQFIEDESWLRALVTRLSDTHEASRATPWKIDDAPPEYIEKMLAAIVGFELPIVSLTGKWKVSQNHHGANRQGVIAGLRQSSDVEALEIADMLASMADIPPAVVEE
jgi:transcriptional regulator